MKKLTTHTWQYMNPNEGKTCLDCKFKCMRRIGRKLSGTFQHFCGHKKNPEGSYKTSLSMHMPSISINYFMTACSLFELSNRRKPALAEVTE